MFIELVNQDKYSQSFYDLLSGALQTEIVERPGPSSLLSKISNFKFDYNDCNSSQVSFFCFGKILSMILWVEVFGIQILILIIQDILLPEKTMIFYNFVYFFDNFHWVGFIKELKRNFALRLN